MLDDWRRSDSRFSLRELRQQVIVRKRWALGCELLVGAIRLTRQGRGFLQGALDRVPFRKDLGDVLSGNLALEFRVRHGLWPAEPILESEHAKQNAVAHDPRRRRNPPAALSARVSARHALGAPRAGRLLIGRSVGWLSIGLSGRRRRRRGSLLGHDPRSQYVLDSSRQTQSTKSSEKNPVSSTNDKTRQCDMLALDSTADVWLERGDPLESVARLRAEFVDDGRCTS